MFRYSPLLLWQTPQKVEFFVETKSFQSPISISMYTNYMEILMFKMNTYIYFLRWSNFPSPNTLIDYCSSVYVRSRGGKIKPLHIVVKYVIFNKQPIAMLLQVQIDQLFLNSLFANIVVLASNKRTVCLWFSIISVSLKILNSFAWSSQVRAISKMYKCSL